MKQKRSIHSWKAWYPKREFSYQADVTKSTMLCVIIVSSRAGRTILVASVDCLWKPLFAHPSFHVILFAEVHGGNVPVSTTPRTPDLPSVHFRLRNCMVEMRFDYISYRTLIAHFHPPFRMVASAERYAENAVQCCAVSDRGIRDNFCRMRGGGLPRQSRPAVRRY